MQNTAIKITLNNGLTVLYEYDNNLPIVCLELWLKCGSINEKKLTSGISHFIEHMVFKNTHVYKNNSISRTIEEIGGEINAATSTDYTYYYVESLNKVSEKSFSVLSQIAGFLDIKEKDLEKEKNIIIEEIRRDLDSPFRVLIEEVFKEMFLNHPYSMPIIGNESNINKFSSDDLMAYYKKYYTPNNMTLIVVGDISRAQIDKNLNKYFMSLKLNKEFKSSNYIKELPVKVSKKKIEKVMPVGQTYFVYCYKIPSQIHNDYYPLYILDSILGFGLSSRLYLRLKEELGLVWSVTSQILDECEASVFSIYGTANYSNLDKIDSEIKNIINSIIQEGIKEEELKKVKNLIKSDHYLNIETLKERSSGLGYYNVLGDYNLFYNYIDKLNKVSCDDVLRVAKKYLNDEYILGIVKPKK